MSELRSSVLEFETAATRFIEGIDVAQRGNELVTFLLRPELANHLIANRSERLLWLMELSRDFPYLVKVSVDLEMEENFRVE